MRYPIAIEQADHSSFGIVVPDLPGCFSAGDSLDEAMENAKDATQLWLETVIEDGGLCQIPPVSMTTATTGISKTEFGDLLKFARQMEGQLPNKDQASLSFICR